MSLYSGPQGKNARKRVQADKRSEAAERQSRVLPSRTKAHRLGPVDGNGNRTPRSIARYQSTLSDT